MHTLLVLVLAACYGSSEPAPAAASASARHVDVLIDGNGYTPASVDAKPGEDLTLVFERLDERNCGGTVVFPATGERHEVPVGKKVEVAVKAPPSGSLAFTCGMGMYEGSLVVSGS